MKWIRCLLIVILTGLVSCEDDPVAPDTPSQIEDEFVGNMSELSFSESLEGFESDRAVLHILAPDGTLIERQCDHTRSNGVSSLSLAQGLKAGTYRLLYLEYELPQPIKNGEITTGHFGLGCSIDVSDIDFDIEDYYDKEMGLYGKGTEEFPYIVTSDDHLATISKKVNDSRYNGDITTDTYFKQYADIDMERMSFECDNLYGWSPIGGNETVPFRGHYDGSLKLITGLEINRKNDGGVGLFGYVAGGVIRKVRISDSSVSGNLAVGALVGTITTRGGERDCSLVDSCYLESGVKVIGSEGSVSTGGLIGCIDMYARATVTECTISGDATVSSSYNAGGVIGSSSMFSSTLISGCVNNASVTSEYSGCGGIIATGDTLNLTGCKNYGEIAGSTLYVGAEGTAGIGTGGLVGGSGVSTIAGSINYGTVKGKDGVGGIIGSTRVKGSDTEAYTYNNTMIISGGNEGDISGEIAVGGLCGEAQCGAFGVYNTGNVTGKDYTAGIAGCTSVAVIHNAVNSGAVTGETYTSGIVSKTCMGSLALNQNYGVVKGSGSCAGGILALGGTSTVINYCGNHNSVSAGAEGPVGGIVGEIGDPREWTLMNYAECIIGAAEVVMGILGPCFAIFEYAGTELPHVILRIEKGIDVTLLLCDTSLLSYGIYEMVAHHHAEALSTTMKVKTQQIASEVTTKLSQIRTSLSNFAIEPFHSGAFSTDYLGNIQSLESYYTASDENADKFNDNINEARLARAEELAHYSETKEIVHSVIAGVCILVGTVATVASAVVTGGTTAALAISAIGGMSSLVGGTNAIVKVTTDFEDNAVIISQCVNTGYIQSGDNSSDEAGGLVGVLNDNSILRDCLNAAGGNNAQGGGHLIGTLRHKSEVTNCLTIAAQDQWYDLFDSTDAMYSYSGLYYYTGEVSTRQAQLATGCQRLPEYYAIGLSQAEIANKESFEDWDFTTKWSIPSATNAFPLPYKSEYQE